MTAIALHPSASAEMAAVAASLTAMRPRVGPTSGPKVSMVVPTRDGADHLRRLFSGLRDRTAYRSFEVIVIDNASSDDTPEVLAQDWGFPIRVVTNSANRTFSEACNQGAAAAEGAYVLLLNNDVDPINQGWLGALVTALESRPESIAAGALLIYPTRPRDEDSPPPPFPDLTVQHFGMAFEYRNGLARATNLCGGQDPRRLELAQTRRVAGVTAACLLVSAADYAALGGMPDGYVYGTEDWEFCLRLRRTGRNVVAVGEAALFHHESASISVSRARLTRMNRKGNRQRFAERWAPRMNRTLLLDRFRGERRWSARSKATIGITIPASTTEGRNRHVAEQAKALGRGFEQNGWDVELLAIEDKTRVTLGRDLDAVILTRPVHDLRGLKRTTIVICWVLDEMRRWSTPRLERADFVLAGSTTAADVVALRTGVRPVVAFPVITDINPALPEPSPTFASDYAFLGDAKQFAQRLLAYLEVNPDESVRIFGSDWADEPRAGRYWRGEIETSERRDAIANARIVVGLRDPNMASLDTGTLETASYGALPVTDDVEMARDMLGELVPTFTTSRELRRLLDRFGTDEDARSAALGRLRDELVHHHTALVRANEVAAAIEREVAKPKIALKISPPSKDVMEKWGDTHFARQYARALRRAGFRTDMHILPEWDLPDRQDADIVVHLRGLNPYVPKPGAFNILWIISHPDEITPEECERYDLVLAASSLYADQLRARVDVPVETMLQATDPSVFRFVVPDPSLRSEVLFVGNARWPARRVPRWLMELGAPLSIYGANWERFAEHDLVRGGFVPNADLHRLYCSADILANDHWADMKEHGFIANRVFDALACGAFIISDRVDAIGEVFGDAVPMFSTKDELAAVLEQYRDDPDARARHALAGMRLVREHHTFDVRAQQLQTLIRRHRPNLELTVI